MLQKNIKQETAPPDVSEVKQKNIIPAAEKRSFIMDKKIMLVDGAAFMRMSAASEGFWMVQITAPADAYDEAACFGYLDSVKFK